MTSYFEKLKLLQENAYAPYSNFKVASILVTQDSQEFPGVNVENASFGGTICAERSSFVSAISTLGANLENEASFKEIHLLAGRSKNFAMPCGLCRQLINEFVDKAFKIVVYNEEGEQQVCDIDTLLPHSFSRKDLDVPD